MSRRDPNGLGVDGGRVSFGTDGSVNPPAPTSPPH
jgi:hypothetical protein